MLSLFKRNCHGTFNCSFFNGQPCNELHIQNQPDEKNHTIYRVILSTAMNTVKFSWHKTWPPENVNLHMDWQIEWKHHLPQISIDRKLVIQRKVD